MTDPTPLRPRVPPTLTEEIERTLSLDYQPEPVKADVHDLGRLTSEAVKSTHEISAKAIEDMGREIIERTHNLESALARCDEVLKGLTEAANQIREEGKLVAAQIDESNSRCEEIRKAAMEFVKK